MSNTVQNPKRVVCFGDSNTWGYIPNTQAERLDASKRWPGVLQHLLGNDYTILEEALNGRTTVWDDPLKPGRNGSKHLPTVLESHTPVDLLIIALGVNDLKHHFNFKANDIALGVSCLAEMALQSGAGRLSESGVRQAPEVLLLSPALPVSTPSPVGRKFDGASERGVGLGEAIAASAADLECHFLDLGTIVTTPDTDGIHLDVAGHLKVATAVAELLKNILI